jgi:hypothetical protein
MHRILIGCVSLLLTFGATARAQGSLELPEEVRGTVVRVLNLLDRAYVYEQHEREEVSRLGEEFARTMDELAEQLDPGLEERALARAGEDVAARLIVIASDRRSRPGLYEEIRHRYIEGVDAPQRVAPAAPRLDPRHATEPYHLVWEYFLLEPPSQQQSFKADQRISEALARINNPDSVPVILRAYRATTQPPVRLSRFVANRQRLLLQTLGQIPAPSSLQAMLQALEWSQEQLARGMEPRPGAVAEQIRFEPQEYVLRLLTDQENFGTGAEWRAVVSSVPAEMVPNRYVPLLEQVKRRP